MTAIVRPSRPDDLAAIFDLAKLTGGGFTNLPADRGALAYVTNREIPAMPASMPGGRLLQITLAPATDPLSAITSEVIHLLPSATYAGMALAQAVANGDPPAVSLRCGDTAFDRAARAGFQHAMRNAPTPIALTLDSARDHAAPPFGCSAKGPNAGGTYLLDDINQSDPTSAAGLVTPAMASRDYPHSGKRFAKAFKDFHAREPDRFAIYGYEAAGLALNAITDAGETGDAVTRVATLKAALALRNRFGPVGHYDVLPNGQTTLYMFGIRSWPPDIKAEEEESRTIEVDRG